MALARLRSKHFRDNQRLQSCLVSDAAHVTPGQSGEHVSLIQFALMRLLVLDLPETEIKRQFYGPKTAEAVLTYKRSLEIINRSYQKQADNIVGRMTIRSLDNAMFVLEGGDGPAPQPNLIDPPIHPQSPSPAARPSPPSPNLQQLASARTIVQPIRDSGTGDAVEAPLSGLPDDLQKAIRRSNAVKQSGDLMLFPFIGNDEGPLSGKELSKRFADNKSAMDILVAVHRRMTPFGIFDHINIIHNTFQGVGSKGFFCEPFNHDLFLALMTRLTEGKMIDERLRDSSFCRDKFNVHGPRTSFREIVATGEGLHICITEPARRSDTHCDTHIDEVQQGQICFDGFCVPILNKQTVEHLKTVGPWLRDEAKRTVVDWAKRHTPTLPKLPF
jgi:hypothetical protein